MVLLVIYFKFQIKLNSKGFYEKIIGSNLRLHLNLLIFMNHIYYILLFILFIV